MTEKGTKPGSRPPRPEYTDGGRLAGKAGVGIGPTEGDLPRNFTAQERAEQLSQLARGEAGPEGTGTSSQSER